MHFVMFIKLGSKIQIGALSILGILPINLTELWQGMAAGRRKKRQTPSTTLPPHVAQATKDIGMKLLKVSNNLIHTKIYCIPASHLGLP